MPPLPTTVELQVGSPEAARTYRTMLGDIRGIAVSDRPLLEGCVADAAIAPTNSFGYLDAGIDGAFARRFGRRLQRALQERIGLDFDGEMPVGEALVLPTGDLSLQPGTKRRICVDRTPLRLVVRQAHRLEGGPGVKHHG